jgi:hypothetical protein
MKASIVFVVMVFLQACAADDPEVGTKQQDEMIEVHGCSPGWIDDGDRCIDPWHGGGWGPGPGNIGGHERVPGGGRGGAGPAEGGGDGVGVNQYVFEQYSTIGGTICRNMCVILSGAICAAVILACESAATVTLGGAIVPCARALIAACIVGQPLQEKWCSEWICPD